MNFGDLLNKYGVTWKEEYLTYKPVANRLGNKLTGVIFHTEGLDSEIPGIADRDIYNFFNNPNNQANAHGYITFSGVFILYIPIEDGCWGAGNADDNAQTFQVETQDNGRWRNAGTYTEKQYRAWIGLYAALVEYSETHPDEATPILFENSKRGGRPHNQIVIGRACPGALDWQRIIREAKELYIKVNNPIPAWKQNAANVGDKTFKTEKIVNLFDFEAGTFIKAFPIGSEITVRYLSKNHYITPSSYEATRPWGILKEDLEYIVPMPLPDEIVYKVYLNSIEVHEDKSEHNARTYYAVLHLIPGDIRRLTKYNKTKKIEIEELLKEIIPTPVPEPIPQPDPIEPEPIKSIWQVIVDIMKSIYEFFKNLIP